MATEWIDKINLENGRYHQYSLIHRRFYLFDKNGLVLGSRKTRKEIEQLNKEV